MQDDNSIISLQSSINTTSSEKKLRNKKSKKHSSTSSQSSDNEKHKSSSSGSSRDEGSEEIILENENSSSSHENEEVPLSDTSGESEDIGSDGSDDSGEEGEDILSEDPENPENPEKIKESLPEKDLLFLTETYSFAQSPMGYIRQVLDNREKIQRKATVRQIDAEELSKREGKAIDSEKQELKFHRRLYNKIPEGDFELKLQAQSAHGLFGRVLSKLSKIFETEGILVEELSNDLKIDRKRAISKLKKYLTTNPDLFFLIVISGHIELLELAIEIGGKRLVNSTNVEWQKQTALHIAIRAPEHCRVQVANILLDHGASATKRDFWKNTPLHRWVTSANLDICSRIFHANKTKTTRRNVKRWTPIHQLCFVSKKNYEQSAAIAEMILSEKRNLARKRSRGTSPLPIMYAVQNRNAPLVAVLLKHDKKVFNRKPYQTFLMNSRAGSSKITRILLEHANDSVKKRVVSLVIRPFYPKMTALPVHNTGYNSGASILEWICMNGFVKVLKEYLQNGLYNDRLFKPKNRMKRNCFIYAATKGHYKIVEYFVNEFEKLFPNQNKDLFFYHKDKEHLNALHLVCLGTHCVGLTNAPSHERGHKKVCQILLTLPGFNVNEIVKILNTKRLNHRSGLNIFRIRSWTLLHIVIVRGSKDLFKVLVEAGAQITHGRKKKYTPHRILINGNVKLTSGLYQRINNRLSMVHILRRLVWMFPYRHAYITYKKNSLPTKPRWVVLSSFCLVVRTGNATRMEDVYPVSTHNFIPTGEREITIKSIHDKEDMAILCFESIHPFNFWLQALNDRKALQIQYYADKHSNWDNTDLFFRTACGLLTPSDLSHPSLQSLDNSGRSLLHIAAAYGQLTSLRLLLGSLHFSVSQPDSLGYTPLDYALYWSLEVPEIQKFSFVSEGLKRRPFLNLWYDKPMFERLPSVMRGVYLLIQCGAEEGIGEGRPERGTGWFHEKKLVDINAHVPLRVLITQKQISKQENLISKTRGIPNSKRRIFVWSRFWFEVRDSGIFFSRRQYPFSPKKGKFNPFDYKVKSILFEHIASIDYATYLDDSAKQGYYFTISYGNDEARVIVVKDWEEMHTWVTILRLMKDPSMIEKMSTRQEEVSFLRIAADPTKFEEFKTRVETTKFTVDISSSLGRTAVFFAAENGTDCFNYLVEKGADIDSPDSLGWYPVHIAGFYANTGVLKCIASSSLKRLVVTSKFSKSTPLHRIVQNVTTNFEDKLNSIKLLLTQLSSPEITALINRRDYYYGFTPLHFATMYGNKEILRLLLRAGASNAIRAKNGLLAIQMAESQDVADIFLQSHDAALLGDVEYLKELTDRKAIMCKQDFFGKTLLHKAAASGSVETVKFILDNPSLTGDLLSLVDAKGRVAVFEAVEHGHIPVVELFLEISKDHLERRDYVGNTLLHAAVSMGQKEMFDYLVSKGCNPAAKNSLEKEAEFYWRAASTPRRSERQSPQVRHSSSKGRVKRGRSKKVKATSPFKSSHKPISDPIPEFEETIPKKDNPEIPKNIEKGNSHGNKVVKRNYSEKRKIDLRKYELPQSGPKEERLNLDYDDEGPKKEKRNLDYDDEGPKKGKLNLDYDDEGPKKGKLNLDYDDEGPKKEKLKSDYDDEGPKKGKLNLDYDDEGPKKEKLKLDDDEGPKEEKLKSDYDDEGPKKEKLKSDYDDEGPKKEKLKSEYDDEGLKKEKPNSDYGEGPKKQNDKGKSRDDTWRNENTKPLKMEKMDDKKERESEIWSNIHKIKVPKDIHFIQDSNDNVNHNKENDTNNKENEQKWITDVQHIREENQKSYADNKMPSPSFCLKQTRDILDCYQIQYNSAEFLEYERLEAFQKSSGKLISPEVAIFAKLFERGIRGEVHWMVEHTPNKATLIIQHRENRDDYTLELISPSVQSLFQISLKRVIRAQNLYRIVNGYQEFQILYIPEEDHSSVNALILRTAEGWSVDAVQAWVLGINSYVMAIRDWSLLFRKFVDAIPREESHSLTWAKEQHLRLRRLGREFSAVTTALAQIIITEKDITDRDKKLFPSIDAGGAAGGTKYLIYKLFFKYPENKFYENQYAANKSARLEMNGTNSIMDLIFSNKVKYNNNSLKLVCPLWSLVDFRGWRILCSSEIPNYPTIARQSEKMVPWKELNRETQQKEFLYGSPNVSELSWYYTSKEEWRPIDSKIAEKIENGYKLFLEKRSNNILTYSIGDFQYSIDFDTGYQTNNTLKIYHQIRRENGVGWSFLVDVWSPYDPQSDAIIKSAQKRKEKTVELQIGGQKCIIDLSNLTQTINNQTVDICESTGQNLLCASPYIASTMQQVGQLLNLACRPACNKTEQHLLYGPIDIEIWRGHGEGNEGYAYLLDTHRIFPPAGRYSAGGRKEGEYVGYFFYEFNRLGQCLFQLLRKEAVTSWSGGGIHSDALMRWNTSLEAKREAEEADSSTLMSGSTPPGWNGDTPGDEGPIPDRAHRWHVMHNERVLDLLRNLEQKVVPDFVKKLLKECPKQISEHTMRIVLQQMKVRGINCRYLGLIFWHCLEMNLEKISEKNEEKGKGKDLPDKEEKYIEKDGKKKNSKTKEKLTWNEETSESTKLRRDVAKQLIGIELVARTVKIAVNRFLSRRKNVMEFEVKQVYCDYFIRLSSEEFWEKEFVATLYQWFGPAPVSCLKELKNVVLDRDTLMVLLERLVQLTGTHWKENSFKNYPDLQPRMILNITPKVKLLNQFMFESAQYAHSEHMTLEQGNKREIRILVQGQFRKVSPNWNHVCQLWFDILDSKPMDIRSALKLTEAESYAIKWNNLLKFTKNTDSVEKFSKIVDEKTERFIMLCNTILFLFKMMSKKLKFDKKNEKEKVKKQNEDWEELFSKAVPESKAEEEIKTKKDSKKKTKQKKTKEKKQNKLYAYKASPSGLLYSTFASFLIQLSGLCESDQVKKVLNSFSSKYFQKSLKHVEAAWYPDKVEILFLNALYSDHKTSMLMKQVVSMICFEEKAVKKIKIVKRGKFNVEDSDEEESLLSEEGVPGVTNQRGLSLSNSIDTVLQTAQTIIPKSTQDQEIEANSQNDDESDLESESKSESESESESDSDIEPIRVGKKHLIKWNTPPGYNPEGDVIFQSRLDRSTQQYLSWPAENVLSKSKTIKYKKITPGLLYPQSSIKIQMFDEMHADSSKFNQIGKNDKIPIQSLLSSPGRIQPYVQSIAEGAVESVREKWTEKKEVFGELVRSVSSKSLRGSGVALRAYDPEIESGRMEALSLSVEGKRRVNPVHFGEIAFPQKKGSLKHLNTFLASHTSMQIGNVISYRYLVALYNQALLEQAIVRIINTPNVAVSLAKVFCAQLAEIDSNNFYLCYCFAKIGYDKLEAEVSAKNVTLKDIMDNPKKLTPELLLMKLSVLETKKYFGAAYALYPRTHDNINFIIDYVNFLAKYTNKKKKIITILLHALENDPHNDILLTAFSDEFISTCDSRIEILFTRVMTYHKDSYIELLYANYLNNVVKDYDRAYLYYKTSLANIGFGDEQEKVRKSYVLHKISHLFETYFQDYSAAEESYQESIKLDPTNVEAHFFYASFLVRIKQNYPLANQHYLKALLLNPNNMGVLHAFVKFLRETKNPLFALLLENWLLPPLPLKKELKSFKM